MRTSSFMMALSTILASNALAAPPAYQTAVAGGNPVLWYKFNEAANATTFANSGSLGSTFNATIPASGMAGNASFAGDNAVRFAGDTTQFLVSGGTVPTNLRGNPTFTCEAVVKVTSYTGNSFGYAPLLYWGAAATGQSVYFSNWYTSPNRMYTGFYNGGLLSSCTLPLNRWCHVVWVRDSNGGANGQYVGSTLYINGKVAAETQDLGLPGAPVINVQASPFYINSATDGVRRMNMMMDELALYDRALTATEVQQRFSALGIPRCVADVAQLGGSATCSADGQVSADDLVAYLGAFFAGNLELADIASLGGNLAPDGRITADDLIAYLGAFFAGCQ